MSATDGSRKTLRLSFLVTMASVGLVYLWHDLSGSHVLPRKWLVGWYAFSGLVAINIVLFIVTLIRSMWAARSISQEDASEEEKERLVEEIMVPALQGRAEPPEPASSIVEIPLGIAAGLLSGVLLCGAVLLVLRWAGVHP
jgi:uncharacterized membrane protein YfcA